MKGARRFQLILDVLNVSGTNCEMVPTFSASQFDVDVQPFLQLSPFSFFLSFNPFGSLSVFHLT